MGQEFLGVYATNEAAPSLGDFPRPLGKRKRLWFVWGTADGRYKVQALNAVYQPMADPRVITPDEFERRYAPQPECAAVPEGYAKPEAVSEVPAPGTLLDIFSQSVAAPPQAHSFFYEEKFADDGRLRADDPDLLRNWVKGEPKRKEQVMDPVRIPFDRLVGETEQDEAGSDAPDPPRDPSVFPEAGDTSQPEEARLLRSKFVRALLLLRRGEREDAVILLQDILNKTYPPFTGAAQLFSEFGLGLRRLGLVRLALAAHMQARQYAPQDERVLFNIARSYHDLGLLDEAREYLEKALALSPEFASAKQFLAFLDSGKQRGA